MKYRFTRLPNVEQFHKYKVCGDENKTGIIFKFSYPIIVTWGNPLKEILEQLMIAYIKRNGWPKDTVEFNSKNSPHNLSQYLSTLILGKSKPKKQTVKA